MSDEILQWHRWFGLAWTDHLHGEAATVEIERDLSMQKQQLDVAVVRTDPKVPITVELPDGFDALAEFNLISFKSYREPFDAKAMWELVGHFVNYRKQVSPSHDDLFAEGRFRLFAVAVRYPENLAARMTLERVSAGVYDVNGFGLTVRLVVIHELPLAQQNAMLLLFSFRERDGRFGFDHYSPRSMTTSSFLNRLFEIYREEGYTMPYTVEEFNREYAEELLGRLTPEQLLARVPVEKRLAGIPAATLVRSLTPEQRAALLAELGNDPTPGTPPPA